VKDELLAITRSLHSQLQHQLEATPWLHRAPAAAPAPITEPKVSPKKPAAPSAPKPKSIVAPVEKPKPVVSAPIEKPVETKISVDPQVDLQAVRQLMGRLAPHMGHVDPIPTQARPRCLLIAHDAQERPFLERLAQALTARVAPARVIDRQELERLARPPVRLLVATGGQLPTGQLPLIELEPQAHYNDKAAKAALWKQLCQALS
jgi:hypothetical protein